MQEWRIAYLSSVKDMCNSLRSPSAADDGDDGDADTGDNKRTNDRANYDADLSSPVHSV